MRDFEFSALQEARNYRAALVEEFAPYLGARVLEIGAGIGQLTQELLKVPQIKSLACVEPSAEFCRIFREKFPSVSLVEGSAANLDANSAWDTIVSVNVLEHIQGDEQELALYRKLLEKTRGHLCLFVPARPELYSLLDKDFGHFRRYTRKGLEMKLQRQGFEILRSNYFNALGYLAWWLHFRVLKKRSFDPAAVRAFDRFAFPVVRWWEKTIARPPLGQSLLVVARSNA